MITMDLQEKDTSYKELMDNKKCCTDCKTTKTPLWRGGPAGPKTLCNACGIRYRKRRVSTVGLRLNKGREKKREKTQSRVGGEAVGDDGDDLKELVKMKLMALGEEVLLQRSNSVVKKQRWQRRRRELGEVEQAAFCLMALSCGSVFA
ncbi:GATA transcription factor 16-like [Prosopis cineraria]|uniref:GATA transcription factor 16-like n=1 Tax=Prosopis cineraria TaxID=364024 RepID=UPI00240ECBBA|nr:GATA transcription factor 16-like [Prosopis cineraria]XP_054783787.1 GATA transcription factor 16-like [Prosopis cineraria]